MVQYRNTQLAGLVRYRIEKLVIGSTTGRELYTYHPLIDAQPHLSQGVVSVVGIHDTVAEHLLVLPSHLHQSIVGVFYVLR
jgi:hypothetical protein